MDYSKFILRDPQVCGGEPVIAGTRVTLRTILASLAEGAGIRTVSQDERRLLITQDLDFSDSRRFQPGMHHGIILVQLRTPGREVLFRRIVELFRTEVFEKWAGCFVVVTDHKIRIQRPGQ